VCVHKLGHVSLASHFCPHDNGLSFLKVDGTKVVIGNAEKREDGSMMRCDRRS